MSRALSVSVLASPPHSTTAPPTLSASRLGLYTLSRCGRLLDPDRITTADCAAPHYGRMPTNVDLVMLGRCAQDSRIPREIPLRKVSHPNPPQGPVMFRRTTIPMASLWLTQAFSAKSFSPEVSCTTMFK